MRTNWLPVALACAVFTLGGCLPDDMPAYVNDGKTIVAAAGGNLWTYDVKSETATSHPASAPWNLHSARVIDGQVYVFWQHNLGGANNWEFACKRFDPAKNQYIDTPPKPRGSGWLMTAIPYMHDGKKYVLAQSDKGDGFDLLSLPDLKKDVKVLKNDMSGLMGAGNFWTVRLVRGNHMDVFMPNERMVTSLQVSSIPKDQLALAGQKELNFNYARVSLDGRTLLLAYAKEKGWGFAVFDILRQKLLWKWDQDAGEAARFGTPLMTADSIWSIIEVPKNAATQPATVPAGDQPTQAALVQYTPGKGDKAQQPTRDIVLVYPVDGKAVKTFAPSPDGKKLLVVVEGTPPKILIFPLEKNLREKDVQVIALKAKE